MSMEQQEPGDEARIPLGGAVADARRIARGVVEALGLQAPPRTWYGNLGRRLVALERKRRS